MLKYNQVSQQLAKKIFPWDHMPLRKEVLQDANMSADTRKNYTVCYIQLKISCLQHQMIYAIQK